MVEEPKLVFVFHPAVGVTRVPAAYMAAYEGSGFRYATKAEIARWYEDHGLPRPRRLPAPPLDDWAAAHAGTT